MSILNLLFVSIVITTIIEKDSFNTNYNDSRIEKAELYIRDQNDLQDLINSSRDLKNKNINCVESVFKKEGAR